MSIHVNTGFKLHQLTQWGCYVVAALPFCWDQSWNQWLSHHHHCHRQWLHSWLPTSFLSAVFCNHTKSWSYSLALNDVKQTTAFHINILQGKLTRNSTCTCFWLTSRNLKTGKQKLASPWKQSTVIFSLLSAPVYKQHPLIFFKILSLSTYRLHWFISRTYDTPEHSIQHTPKPQQKWRAIEITKTRYLAKQIGILFTCFWIIIMIREYRTCFIVHSAWRWAQISETALH